MSNIYANHMLYFQTLSWPTDSGITEDEAIADCDKITEHEAIKMCANFTDHNTKQFSLESCKEDIQVNIVSLIIHLLYVLHILAD